MKKVLVIGHSLVLEQNRDIFRHLHETGLWDVTIAAPRFFHGDLRDITIEAEPSGSTMKVVPVECYGTSRIHFFFYNTFQVEKILEEEKFDAVYLWEEAYIVSGFTLAHVFHKRKIPYFIFSCQNIYKKYPWPFSFFESLVLKNAKGLIACGYGVQDVFKKKGYASEVVPFFVSLERFRPKIESEKKQAREALGLKNTLTVGFMGRLVEEKGLRVFMKAVDEVQSALKCNIIVIGSGELHAEVQNWVNQKDNAQLLALKHHEVPEVLSVLDVIMCPSQSRKNWEEQFGRMLVEAFASGVAVVGSDSGEIPYVIGDAGIILPEADIPAWVSAVIELLDDQKKREGFIEVGLSRSKKYSVAAVADALSRFVDKQLK